MRRHVILRFGTAPLFIALCCALAYSQEKSGGALSEADVRTVVSCAWNRQINMLGATYKEGSTIHIRYHYRANIETDSFRRLYVAIYQTPTRKGRLFVFGVPKSGPREFTLANEADFAMSGSGWLVVSDPFGGIGSMRSMGKELNVMKDQSDEVSMILPKKLKPPASCINILAPALHK